MRHEPLRPTLSEEVADALAEGKPVVALESTIISHGMPFPQNVETARAVEATVRANGAVPATIAVLDGVLRAGLDAEMLERFGDDKSVVKASSRDLACVLAAGGSAGTTVSATMRIAELAGIGIFATGGIGGVHREAEATFDISADLTELGHTPTTVVCAGVKSILDIPKTLEYLETQRVPVIVFGSTEFPAFYTRHSGVHVDQRLDTPEAIARTIALHHRLGSGTGLLIANPIPEAAALDHSGIDATIAAAVEEARQRGISGKEVTPFLLARLNELTSGKSLEANIALVLNNAALAARIAAAGDGSR
ncbi:MULTISPECIES: pseudouridine-5'-phosphate glycosidase [unclassified Mesorhizobium]|uniref:pseudouridine-5'-phosphate glycosidase n=1 Tax=unclassified Mesorhizobium TaxID=325217 RepID=UPI0019265A77|nr:MULTISPECIES: pseudouridine-5'-phosphate glycosidase [unclassified Mesorhizobium]BCH23068.1 pseudouridine-5'-phosphate glycosidase [Mesorhizobium sp. L-8-3]